MSDYTFWCPSCGQKMSGDPSYRGKHITCPACQRTIIVPIRSVGSAAPPASAASGTSAPAVSGPPGPNPAGSPAGTSRPPGSPARAPASPSPGRSPAPGSTNKSAEKSGASGLAITALIGSVLAVPGIVCGHLALAPHREATRKQRQLAITGLVIGYCVLIAGVIVFAGHMLRRPTLVMRDTVGGQPLNPSRIVDEVKILNPASETEHQFKNQGVGGGVWENRPFRLLRNPSGGSFSYVMKVLPGEAMTLNCTYWGSDTDHREFDILVDGSRIAHQKLDYNSPGHFFDMEYGIPKSLTRGKSQVTVEFRSPKGMYAGEIFGCQILKK